VSHETYTKHSVCNNAEIHTVTPDARCIYRDVLTVTEAFKKLPT